MGKELEIVNQELKNVITELAQLQFTDGEIAIIVQLEAREMVKKHRLDIDRGRLLAEAEVRKAILTLAKQGSTPAQKQFMELNAKAKEDSDTEYE